MNRSHIASRQRAIACTCALVMGILSIASAPAAEPKNHQGDVAALSAKLLANPLDADTVAKLQALRSRQHDATQAALEALEKGLVAYLARRADEAAIELPKAAAHHSTAQMANAMLGMPLQKIIARCKGKARPKPAAKPDAEDVAVCPKCGNTGWADCPRHPCYGSGALPCTACHGKGTITRTKVQKTTFGTMPQSTTTPCRKCRGKGTYSCPRCKGRGVVPCDCQAGKAVRANEPRAPKQARGRIEKRAIKHLIARARFLRKGGIDLAAPDALTRAPDLKQ